MKSALLSATLLFTSFAFAGNIDSLLKQAKSGNNEAMYQIFFDLAQKNSPDHPLTQDEEELARFWLIKAGENNNWRAAYVLKLCYEKGCWGLPVDVVKSKHYKAVLETYGPNPSFNRDPQQQASPAVGAR